MDLSTSPKKTNRTKTTLWGLFHLYINVIIGLIRAFLIIPLYLQFISIDLYGAWLATGNVLMWLTLFDPGVGDVAIQKVAEAYGKNDKITLKYIISSSVFISVVICILVLIIGVSITDYLIAFVRIPPHIDQNHLKKAFNIEIISTAITLFFYSLSGVILGFQQIKLLGWIRNCASLLTIGINIILLFNGFQLLSISYASLLGSSFQAISYGILLFILIKKENIGFAFNFSFLKNYIRLFSITFFSKLFGTIAQNIDLILISRYVSLDKVTMLEMTRRPLKVIRGLAITPSQALLPTVAHLFGERNFEKLRAIIGKLIRVFILMFVLISAGFITFNGPLLTLWIGSKYYIGDYLNFILVLTFFFNTTSYVFYNFAYSLGRIKEISIFEMIKGIASILLLVVFASLWELSGVVYAGLLITFFSEFWFYPYLLNNSIKFTTFQIKIFIKELFFVLIGSSVIIYFFSKVNVDTWFTLIVVSILFTILHCVLFFIISKELRLLVFHYLKVRVK